MIRSGVCAFLLAACTAPALAQVTINDSEITRPPVAENGIQYVLKVRVPEACRAEAVRCPAVYMLDAEYSFPLVSVITEHLAQRSQLPDLVLVGIGYDDVSTEGYRTNRTRDYTPVFVADGGYGARYQVQSGGAAEFLDAIADTIIPHVEAHYPVDRDERTLVGHSYGGLFGAWTLQTRPGLFANYVLVSPSLWYDDGRFLRSLQDSPPQTDALTRVYLAVGEYEEQPENGRAMVTDLMAFDAALEAWDNPNVAHAMRVFDGETHASIFPAAISSGLRALFDD